MSDNILSTDCFCVQAEIYFELLPGRYFKTMIHTAHFLYILSATCLHFISHSCSNVVNQNSLRSFLVNPNTVLLLVRRSKSSVSLVVHVCSEEESFGNLIFVDSVYSLGDCII